MPCTYQSITLQPGESFVLPPGAELIGATDPNSITSENDCANLDNIEQIQCYGIVIASHEGSAPGTEVWVGLSDDPNIFYTGVIFNDQFYPFTSTVGYNENDVATQLQGLPFGSSLSNFCTGQENDGATDSRKSYIIFNTIPSIANNLQLYGYTMGPNDGTGSGLGTVYFTHPVELRSDIVAAGHANVCDCPALP